MSNIAEMWLSQLSVVDHAYIDFRGNVVGGSFNPTFFVAGNVDPVEQVVVDFSTVKKDIKGIIDSKEDGFDHKLWIIEGYSTAEYTITDHIQIKTPTTTLILPISAVKIIEPQINILPEYTAKYVGDAMAQQVQVKMREKYGDSINIECANTRAVHLPVEAGYEYFTYVHGLKDSTSWGCQNIAHGHLSFINIVADSVEGETNLLSTITNDITRAIFIKRENIIHNDDKVIQIGYTTNRGYFEAVYLKDHYNIIVLDTETTVEHLVDYVAERYKEELAAIGATTLFVSEGLSKGAMKRF